MSTPIEDYTISEARLQIQPHSKTDVVHVYVLELEDGRFYVGRTQRTFQRFEQHVTGRGARWTRLHPVKDLHAFHPNLNEDDEDRITLEMMRIHGIDRVRGGSWTRLILSAKDRLEIERQLSSHQDALPTDLLHEIETMLEDEDPDWIQPLY